MAAPPDLVNAQIVNDVNCWVRYRAPDPDNYVDRTAQQVQAFYRLQNYVEPQPGALPGAEPTFRGLGPAQRLVRPPARDLNAEHRQFLDNPMPQLSNDPAQVVFVEYRSRVV
jgi:hypothetical protein